MYLPKDEHPPWLGWTMKPRNERIVSANPSVAMIISSGPAGGTGLALAPVHGSHADDEDRDHRDHRRDVDGEHDPARQRMNDVLLVHRGPLVESRATRSAATRRRDGGCDCGNVRRDVIVDTDRRPPSNLVETILV
ncbi:MAG: hypothetical protein U0575_01610 [Phycisphaerales bacterium]